LTDIMVEKRCPTGTTSKGKPVGVVTFPTLTL
jgi:hypothetical protein